MQKSITFGIIGLIVGLLVGFFAANSVNRNLPQPVSQAQTNAPLQNPQVPNILVKDQPAPNSGMLPDVSAVIEKADAEPTNFEAQIKAGDLYQQIKGFDKAAAFYRRAQNLKPEDYDLTVKLGNTYFDARQFESAGEWYERALAKKPDDTNVRTDLGITFVERANPDFDRAVKEFETSLKSNPKHEPTLYNLGAAHFRKGNKEEAGKILSRLETVNPNGQLVSKLRQIINQL